MNLSCLSYFPSIMASEALLLFNLPSFLFHCAFSCFQQPTCWGDVFSCNISQYSIYPIKFLFQLFPLNSSQIRWSFISFHLFYYLFNQSDLIMFETLILWPLSKFSMFINSTSTFCCDLSSSYVFYSSIHCSSIFSSS